jgi:hypothetical protein
LRREVVGMEGLVRCFSCGSERVDGFGKVIDGSWVDDYRLWGTEAWGKWVCSMRCYWEAVERYGWQYVPSCEEESW